VLQLPGAVRRRHRHKNQCKSRCEPCLIKANYDAQTFIKLTSPRCLHLLTIIRQTGCTAFDIAPNTTTRAALRTAAAEASKAAAAAGMQRRNAGAEAQLLSRLQSGSPTTAADLMHLRHLLADAGAVVQRQQGMLEEAKTREALFSRLLRETNGPAPLDCDALRELRLGQLRFMLAIFFASALLLHDEPMHAQQPQLQGRVLLALRSSLAAFRS
jgi:hypothetical protein